VGRGDHREAGRHGVLDEYVHLHRRASLTGILTATCDGYNSQHARHSDPPGPDGDAMAAPALRAVCLDAYGTLVRITDRRDPYRSLFRLLGVDPRHAARLAMTTGLGVDELARDLAPGREPDLSAVLHDLQAEVSSVRRCDDVEDALA